MIKRKRILHITPSVRLLGARRSLLTLAQHLYSSAAEILVVVPAKGALTDEFDKYRIPYEVIYLPPWRKAKSWFGNESIPQQVKKLQTLIAEFQPDVIHCNEIYPTPHALVAATQGKTWLELLSRFLHGYNVKPMQYPVVTHMRLSVSPKLIKNYYLRDTERLIAVSEGAASDFDGYDWKTEKVRVVYNGVPAEPFAAARAKRADVRARLGFAETDFVIGQFGLMMPRKRPKFLLEAAPKILQVVPHAKFLFIGETSRDHESYLDGIKERAKELGVAHAMVFLPFQTEIAEYFGAIDLNMLVSDDEGFGRVVLEAAAAHVPTVGSRVGGIPELIVDGETGWLLGEPNASDEEFFKSIPQFTDIVKKLSLDADYREHIGSNAAKRAERLFSPERYVEETAKVFDEAISSFGKNRDPW